MLGMMQDWPLRVTRIIDHAAKYHAKRPVISRSVEGPITRSSWAEVHGRALKVAQALVRLGVKPGDDPKDIRRKWRDLVRINHPDRVIARGVPEEAVKLAEKRLAEINEAYEEINRQLAA